MPRKPRQLVDGGIYHIISRGNNRTDVFKVEGGFQWFIELLRSSKLKYPWKIFHYCLMSNHFHILGQVATGSDLPKIMQYLLTHYSRWYQYHVSYEGHLWSGRYKSPLIDRESYLLECARYIERNPLRAGLASSPEDYPWSSYRYYAFGKQDALVDEDPGYLPTFGYHISERQENYRNFVKIPTIGASLQPASYLAP